MLLQREAHGLPPLGASDLAAQRHGLERYDRDALACLRRRNRSLERSASTGRRSRSAGTAQAIVAAARRTRPGAPSRACRASPRRTNSAFVSPLLTHAPVSRVAVGMVTPTLSTPDNGASVWSS